MSLTAACGWSMLRSLLIAGVSLPLCVLLARFVTNHIRRWPIGALAVVFLMPELLVGYAYSNWSFAISPTESVSLMQFPIFSEILCAVIVALKMIPVGTAAVALAPRSPLSDEAIHLKRMTIASQGGRMRSLVDALRMWFMGPGRELVPAFGLMFLLAFQEFEIASLMGTTAWTVWMFDAHARGQFLSETFRLVVLPTLCEAVVVVPLLIVAMKTRQSGSKPRALVALSSAGRLAASCIIGLCVFLVCVLPLVLELKNVLVGLPVVLSSRSQLVGLFREVITGAAFGVLAAVIGFLAVAWVRKTSSRFRTAGLLLLGFPGFWGAFVLGTVSLSLFQTKALAAIYDTPIPLVVTLALFLFPRIALLCLLLFAGQAAQATWLSDLLGQSKDKSQQVGAHHLSWVLSGRLYFVAIAIPAWWGYLNLTLAAMLAPVGMVSAPVNLYNLMHYGRTAALSAIAVLAVVIPLLVIGLTFALLRFVARRNG